MFIEKQFDCSFIVTIPPENMPATKQTVEMIIEIVIFF